jgi:hypothetical protein
MNDLYLNIDTSDESHFHDFDPKKGFIKESCFQDALRSSFDSDFVGIQEPCDDYVIEELCKLTPSTCSQM